MSARVKCTTCTDGSCMLCDDDGMVPVIRAERFAITVHGGERVATVQDEWVADVCAEWGVTPPALCDLPAFGRTIFVQADGYALCIEGVS